MKNLFCCFYLLILIFRSLFCTDFDDCDVLKGATQMVSDLKDAYIKSSPFEEETLNDFEILEWNDFFYSYDIIEGNHEVSDEKKTNEIIKNPNEHLTKLLDKLKKTFSLINEPLNHSIMLNFIDKTINLINSIFDASKKNVNDNYVALKDSFQKITMSINNLDILYKEVDLLYENKIKNRINLGLNFKDNFMFVQGIISGLRKEFKRCSLLYENINQCDKNKKISLLHQHQNNIVTLRPSIYKKTESDVEKQFGFLKQRFFRAIFLFYESLSEIFETENRFFECHFKTFDLMLEDIKECYNKLELLKAILIKN